MSGDQLDLDAIEARANGATPGPWRDRPMGSEGSDVIAGGNTIRTARRPARCREFADATFIAHARDDVPALVAEVRRLRARLALYDPHAPIPEDVGPGFEDLRLPGGDVPPIVAS